MMRTLLLLIFIGLMPLWAMGQAGTTASISGTITGPDGETLPGANVVATHEPSGTVYGANSRADGRFTIKNMRVGGPYTVRVTFVGYRTEVIEGVSLELGQDLTLDAELSEGSVELEEIRVVAEKNAILNSKRTGASTNISTQRIETNPTISRSLSDFARLTPQSTGGNSLAGRNNRYNNILIDGATLNDAFGLPGNGTPGGQAGTEPISLDAIVEFNVDIAPYDVTNSGFTGGQINAITRSGTNQFEGSVYFEGRNENFVGDLKTRDGSEVPFPEFSNSFWGLRVGGPLVKDKLFFFANFELRRRDQPQNIGIVGSGTSQIFPANQAQINEIIDIAQNQYGFDPGGFGLATDEQDNEKALIKLDWNINPKHNLSARWNFVNADDDQGISRSRTSFDLSNRRFVFESKQNSFVTSLKSTLSDNMFNEARVVYTRVRDQRNVQATPFPEVEIFQDFDGDGRTETVSMGVDRFSQANALDQDLVEITNTLTYLRGDHEFTFGTSNQIYSFSNLFIQDFWGAYEFDSVEDFRNGDPSRFLSSFSLLEDNPRPVADWTGFQLGFYAQDKWSIRDNIDLTFGLRIDAPFVTDDPLFNPAAEEAFGRSTSNVPSGNILWSPRFGFNWDVYGDRTTQIRGGTGIFSGRPPFVWVSNAFSNTGMDIGRIDVSGDSAPDFQPDPFNQPGPGTGLPVEETSEINLIDDDFKFPQTWRTNLAVDQELPFGLIGTFEALYSNTVNDVVFENLNINQVGTAFDGRPVYGTVSGGRGNPDRVDEAFTNAILLKNTKEGREISLTGQVQKTFSSGLSGSVSYTWNDAKNVNNATSSRAISNWQFNENLDVNNPRRGTADFEVRNRVLANISYQFAIAERFPTTISFVYEGRSGSPFSWIYFGDANADGQRANDLIYIPETENDIVLTSNNWQALDSFIESEESLRDNRGSVAERNSAREPWRNILDLKITQGIKTIGNQKLELTANIFNVLNMIDKDLGQINFTQFNNDTILNFSQYVDQEFILNNPDLNLGQEDLGKPVVSFGEVENRDDLFNISDLASRWQLQVGLRYSF